MANLTKSQRSIKIKEALVAEVYNREQEAWPYKTTPSSMMMAIDHYEFHRDCAPDISSFITQIDNYNPQSLNATEQAGVIIRSLDNAIQRSAGK